MKRPALMNLPTVARRLLRPTVLTCALAMGGGLAWAQSGFQTSGPILGDEVMYSIGGGSLIEPIFLEVVDDRANIESFKPR